MTIQVSLKSARLLMGLSQAEAARMFGVHYQTLANWEKNPKSMKMEYIEKIPEIYHLPQDNIFFGSDNEFIRYLDSLKASNSKQNSNEKITRQLSCRE